jgi:hypothetical protein
MLQVPNAAAQLMAISLFRRGILYFEGGIRGDVLRHVFGPDDFFRKQIEAEGEKEERRLNARSYEKTKSKSKGNSPSNRAFLRGAALLGLLAFIHGLGVFSSEGREEMRSDG